MYIIDTSVIICGAFSYIEGEKITIKEVIDESKDYKSKAVIDTALMQNDIILKTPTQSSINKIKTKLKEISCNISDTDTKLLALTLDHKNKAILLTDDYSIQNVAKFLNLKFSSVREEGIKDIIKWKFECIGCRKVYEKNYNNCLDCGSKLRRITIKNSK